MVSVVFDKSKVKRSGLIHNKFIINVTEKNNV